MVGYCPICGKPVYFGELDLLNSLLLYVSASLCLLSIFPLVPVLYLFLLNNLSSFTSI